MSAAPAIEREVLRQLEEDLGDSAPEILSGLLDVFLTDTPDGLQRLRQAIEQGELSAAQMAAHALKGSGLALGASGFSQKCRQVEMLARGGSLEGALSLWAEIEAEYQRVAAELQAIAAGYRPA